MLRQRIFVMLQRCDNANANPYASYVLRPLDIYNIKYYIIFNNTHFVALMENLYERKYFGINYAVHVKISNKTMLH